MQFHRSHLAANARRRSNQPSYPLCQPLPAITAINSPSPPASPSAAEPASSSSTPTSRIPPNSSPDMLHLMGSPCRRRLRTTRLHRHGESLFKRFTAGLFLPPHQPPHRHPHPHRHRRFPSPFPPTRPRRPPSKCPNATASFAAWSHGLASSKNLSPHDRAPRHAGKTKYPFSEKCSPSPLTP